VERGVGHLLGRGGKCTDGRAEERARAPTRRGGGSFPDALSPASLSLTAGGGVGVRGEGAGAGGAGCGARLGGVLREAKGLREGGQTKVNHSQTRVKPRSRRGQTRQRVEPLVGARVGSSHLALPAAGAQAQAEAVAAGGAHGAARGGGLGRLEGAAVAVSADWRGGSACAVGFSKSGWRLLRRTASSGEGGGGVSFFLNMITHPQRVTRWS
jgi:hypothetical protein